MYNYSSSDAAKFNVAFGNVSHFLLTSKRIKKRVCTNKTFKRLTMLSPFAFGRSGHGKPGSARHVDPLLLHETCTSWQYGLQVTICLSSQQVCTIHYVMSRLISLKCSFELLTMGHTVTMRLHGSFGIILVNDDASDLAYLIKTFQLRYVTAQIVASHRQISKKYRIKKEFTRGVTFFTNVNLDLCCEFYLSIVLLPIMFHDGSSKSLTE